MLFINAKKIRTPFFILLCFVFSSCLPEKSTINKCWFYTYQTDFSTAQNKGLSPTSFLCIRKDGTYTRDFGIFDYGHWNLKDNELILTSQRNQTTSFKILSLNSYEIVFDMDGKKMNFEGQPLPNGNATEDPFSFENN